MPQMSPMQWMVHFNIFIFNYITVIIIISFVTIKFHKQISSLKKIIKSPFKSKW